MCCIVLLYEFKNLKEIVGQHVQNCLQASLMSLSTQINKISGSRGSVLPMGTTVCKGTAKQAVRAPSKQHCY